MAGLCSLSGTSRHVYKCLVFVFLAIQFLPSEAAVKKYQFDVQVKNVSRLCHAKPIVTVNGMYPGPTIYAREGDRVMVKDTNLLSIESHPFHLHGYNFFVVGTGVGNFDPIKDAAKFNLVDPPERNTVGVPTGGWTSIRFRADNPGVWFMHCHLELHTGWGLKIAFMVEDGPGQSTLYCLHLKIFLIAKLSTL